MTNELLEEEKNELEHLSHEEEVFELDTLITQGVNAKIPVSFKYPNTDKTVGVMIRPLSTEEYKLAVKKAKNLKKNYLIELLKSSLFNTEGEPFPVEVIKELPFGVVTYLASMVNKISGMDLLKNDDGSDEVDMAEAIGVMMGF